MINFKFSPTLINQMNIIFNEILSQNQLTNALVPYLNGTKIIDDSVLKSLANTYKNEKSFISVENYLEKNRAKLLYNFIIFDICRNTKFIHQPKVKINCIDVNQFLKTDPYFSKISINTLNYNNNSITMFNKELEKNQLLPRYIRTRNSDMSCYSELSTINKNVNIPIMLNDEDIISSINPTDKSELAKDLYFLKGDLICFGLGLGYLPYLATLKDNIKSVTVVEDNEDNIKTFKEIIDSQLNSNIEIIHNNELELFNDINFMNKYDSCFVDVKTEDKLMNNFISNINTQINNKYKLPIRYKMKDIAIDVIRMDIYFYLLDVYNKKAERPLTLCNNQTWRENLTSLKDNQNHNLIFEKIDNYFERNKLRITNIKDMTDFLLNDKNIIKVML